MASEILFNQPFKNKIKVVHNKFYKFFFNKDFEKIERIENTSFAFSLFLILNKLYKEEDTLKEFIKEIFLNSLCHWSGVMNFSEKDYQLPHRNELCKKKNNQVSILEFGCGWGYWANLMISLNFGSLSGLQTIVIGKNRFDLIFPFS